MMMVQGIFWIGELSRQLLDNKGWLRIKEKRLAVMFAIGGWSMRDSELIVG